MSRALVLALVLAACGSKKAAPDPAAICASTTAPKGVIVLRVGDPAGGGKARGLKELASRSASKNADVIAELERFSSTADAVAIFTAHAEERDRKVREDLAIVRSIVATITDGDWPFPAELRFPAQSGAPGAVEDIGTKATDLAKPLVDGSAIAAVNERATALANTLRELAASLSAPGPVVLEAIKVSNIAHGKVNETAASLNTTGASLGVLADEHKGRQFADAIRMWTRLSVAAARLTDPWPVNVPPAHTNALVIAGPRQQVVICALPRSFAPPPTMAAALPSIKLVRDALGRSLGMPAGPADAPSLKTLSTALDAALAPKSTP